MTNKLFTSLEEAHNFCDEQFGKGVSFDLVVQQVFVKDLPILVVYISGMVNSNTITTLLANLQSNHEDQIDDEEAYFYAHFNFQGISPLESKDKFLLSILSGQLVIVTKSGF